MTAPTTIPAAVRRVLKQHGHFGKIGDAAPVAHPKSADYPLRRGLRAMASALPAEPRRRRTWRLLRSRQIDQGNTPWCVPTTGKHWERSTPVTQQSGLTNGELYAELKKIDGYPDQEGSDGHALLEWYRDRGMIGNYFWALNGSAATREQVHTWLAEVGPMWFGAYISEQFCVTDAKGVIDPGPEPGTMGHEMMVIGTDRDMFGRDKPGKIILNSWGNDNFGIQGRGFIPDDFFYAVLADNGDLAGVVQTPVVRP